jgi:hypothetical protein
MGKKASQGHPGDITEFLVLFLWRVKPVLCLIYLLYSPPWFEGNLNHLGAGAFEITPRSLPFERVAAAMSKTKFDMGFVMADVRPPLHCPPYLLKISGWCSNC